jgi:5,10-methylenetetrahydrofolate reductase
MMTKKNKADLFSFEFYPPKTEEGAVNLENPSNVLRIQRGISAPHISENRNNCE